MKDNDIVVWCADIGSIKKNNFGWCRRRGEENSPDPRNITIGTSIEAFAEGIAKDLSMNKRVALGFECPLFVPIADNCVDLTSARKGEKDRAWSAGAGASALATGLTECVWILEKIRALTTEEIKVSFKYEHLLSNKTNLFIWEAFVSKDSKGECHEKDAEIAVEAFIRGSLNIEQFNAVTAENPYSLIGAALLRAGLTEDINLLREACVVIKS